MLRPVGSPMSPELEFREVTKTTDTHRIFESTKPEERWSYWRQNAQAVAGKLFSRYQLETHRDPNNEVFFVTNRPAKFQEVCKLLEGQNIRQAPIKLKSLDHCQDLIAIAVTRVFDAYKQLQGPVFIEEAALNLEGFLCFPGHDYRSVVEIGMEQSVNGVKILGKEVFANMHAGKRARTVSVFAYTADGKQAHVFIGESKVTIVLPKQKHLEVDGWDSIVQLDDCPRDAAKQPITLADLRGVKHLVNMRSVACAQMRSVMVGKEYPGVYELHITVMNCVQELLVMNGNRNPLVPSEEMIEKFRSVCAEIKVKPLVIYMNDPGKPVQLQTAAYHSCADFAEAHRRAYETARKLHNAGIPILRVRVEAMAGNPQCPQTDDDALKQLDSNYYEFHARLDSVPPSGFAEFTRIVNSYCKGDYGTHAQGKVEVVYSSVGKADRYFINLRGYKLGFGTCNTEWVNLFKELENAGLKIANPNIPKEYCVYDGEPQLDKLIVTKPI